MPGRKQGVNAPGAMPQRLPTALDRLAVEAAVLEGTKQGTPTAQKRTTDHRPQQMEQAEVRADAYIFDNLFKCLYRLCRSG